jgi:hypothetical protein
MTALQPTLSLVLLTRQDSSGRVISASQRPLHTQDKTIYKHKRQTSMLSEGFEPTIPATKRQKTNALECAATESAKKEIAEYINLIKSSGKYISHLL